MSVRDVGDLVIYAGAVAGALGAIGVLLRVLVVRPIRARINEQIETHVSRKLTTVGDQVGEVQAEVSPNRGKSMADAVNRTEVKVDHLANRLDSHLIHHPRSNP